MAGSLIKIDEEIVTSAVASVTLTGIDSTYDVYMVKVNNWTPATDNVFGRARVTVSGTADSTANYDSAGKQLRADTTFSNSGRTNDTEAIVLAGVGTGTSETSQIIYYLFNFNNASEYSFATVEQTTVDAGSVLKGNQGGFVHTVAQACDGIQFFFSSGNIASGKFTLFGLKK